METTMTKRYWESDGKHQDFYNEVAKFMPHRGGSPVPYMAAFIAASQFYRDYYNNGSCNHDIVSSKSLWDLAHYKKDLVDRTDHQTYGDFVSKKPSEYALETVMDALLEIGMETGADLFRDLAYYHMDSADFAAKFGFDEEELENRKIPYFRLPVGFDPKNPQLRFLTYVNFKDMVYSFDTVYENGALSTDPKTMRRFNDNLTEFYKYGGEIASAARGYKEIFGISLNTN